jgi:hypothetical protein
MQQKGYQRPAAVEMRCCDYEAHAPAASCMGMIIRFDCEWRDQKDDTVSPALLANG